MVGIAIRLFWVLKILNISGIGNDHNPVLPGNAVQWSQKSGSGNYEYNGYPLTVDAAESFDSCHVFLLQDVQENTWIIAEDFEEQRFCCIDVNFDDIQNVFCELSNKIQNLLERYYK